MSTYAAEIARLEQLINSSVTSTAADGVSASFDLEAAKRRLSELRRLADPNSKTARRPLSTLDLRNAW